MGPLIFLSFINDLETSLHHSILHIFTDYSKIVKEVTNPSDHDKLQENLDTYLLCAKDKEAEYGVE